VRLIAKPDASGVLPARTREREEERVRLVLDLVAALPAARLPHRLTMHGERVPIPGLAQRAQEARRPLDIRES
jgi:hypothetical protein